MAVKKKEAPAKEIEITIPYTPRPLQREFHNNAKRWNVAVCHRRFGKTCMALNELIRRILMCPHKNPTGVYLAPTFSQAEKVAWTYLMDYTRPIPDVKYNLAKLRCTFPLPGRGTATIHLLSGSNDAGEQIRGMALDFVILDEVADLPEKLFPTIIRPALADRNGGSLWIGTPKGEGPFYDIFNKAKTQVEDGDASWYYCLFRADETGVLDDDEIEEMRLQLSDNQFRQEMLCDFGAQITGAYYAEYLEKAEEQGRVGNVPHDGGLPVHTSWDLGVSDNTSIIFFQDFHGQVRIIDAYQNAGLGLDHYANVLTRKMVEDGFTFGDHYLPHDSKSRRLGVIVSTPYDILREFGFLGTVVPIEKVANGIESVRNLLPHCWFDAVNCAELLKALKHYRVKETSGLPLHDEYSHFADSMRYLATGRSGMAGGGFHRSNWDTPIEYKQNGAI